MKWLGRNRRSPWVPRAIAMLICVGVFAAVVGVRAMGWLEFLELKSFDVLANTQPRDTSLAPKFVFVGMDDADIRKFGFPIPDKTMADLMERVLADKPRAVGVDIFRDMPVPDQGGDDNKRMLDLFKDPKVVSVFILGPDGSPIAATPGVKNSQKGYADFPKDSDGRVRRAQLFFSQNGNDFRAMAVRLAVRYLGESLKRVPGKTDDWFALGKAQYRLLDPEDGGYVRARPHDRGDIIRFDFKGPRDFTPIPVRDAIDGAIGVGAFADKIVVIGMSADTVKDRISTSLEPDQFGSVVHLLLTEQLVRAAQNGVVPPTAWSQRGETLWILGWTLLGGVIGLFARKPIYFAVAALVTIAALIFGVYFAFVGGWWLPALPALFGCVAAGGFVTKYMAHFERAERTVLNELFKRIVDEDVASTLWERRDELLEGGKLAASEIRATVLFTDLEGFTTITEAMDKTCLMAFLNDYMTVMSGVVGRTPDSFVNKYIGDAIMAVFGPPLDRNPDQAKLDAKNAVDCALEMRERLAEHRQRWEIDCSEGIRKRLAAGETPGAVPPWAASVKPPQVQIRMRIGIQSGVVTAGSLGSSQRLEYTVIGDTVNTAARLESFDKDLMPADLAAGGCRILIGQDTLDLLPSGEYLTREVGSIQLKGKEQSVTIHGVIGRATRRTNEK